LRADIYALAALVGAGVVVIGHIFHVPAVVSTVVGGVLCFALRFMAIQYGWHLPTARVPEK
ncbi:MAG TPA: trimeric intracellular cation channel family protein, partial [Gammaproteobacteria bacterium]|nr:trimeric intracellular cation channel family protein [Gammaproteobacteria bacterium]